MGWAPMLVERELETIHSVDRQGVAVFEVEQKATLALAIADRGHAIGNGRIVLAGTVPALVADAAVQSADLGQRVAD